ncbi:uncharacterized protein IWZ02DRAFT_430620 [Phyllosticta citriasiana]|uniref:uncharacterized protein n=1 Tax=Phyllosticta citriasiana TaxID=595635 RepID=UPI0030FD88C7
MSRGARGGGARGAAPGAVCHGSESSVGFLAQAFGGETLMVFWTAQARQCLRPHHAARVETHIDASLAPRRVPPLPGRLTPFGNATATFPVGSFPTATPVQFFTPSPESTPQAKPSAKGPKPKNLLLALLVFPLSVPLIIIFIKGCSAATYLFVDRPRRRKARRAWEKRTNVMEGKKLAEYRLTTFARQYIDYNRFCERPQIIPNLHLRQWPNLVLPPLDTIVDPRNQDLSELHRRGTFLDEAARRKRVLDYAAPSSASTSPSPSCSQCSYSGPSCSVCTECCTSPECMSRRVDEAGPFSPLPFSGPSYFSHPPSYPCSTIAVYASSPVRDGSVGEAAASSASCSASSSSSSSSTCLSGNRHSPSCPCSMVAGRPSSPGRDDQAGEAGPSSAVPSPGLSSDSHAPDCPCSHSPNCPISIAAERPSSPLGDDHVREAGPSTAMASSSSCCSSHSASSSCPMDDNYSPPLVYNAGARFSISLPVLGHTPFPPGAQSPSPTLPDIAEEGTPPHTDDSPGSQQSRVHGTPSSEHFHAAQSPSP